MYSCLLSDDGNNILVFNEEDEEPVEMSLNEFVDAFGEEALPHRDLKPGDVLRDDVMLKQLGDTQHYWASFRRLCEACGSYAWALKLDQKDAYGSHDAHKIIKEVFEEDVVKKLAIEIQERRLRQKTCARNLNYWSQRVGYLPMRDVDMDTLIGHLYDTSFRKRMYYRIDKYAKKDELVSARDLVIDILKSFKKKNKKWNPS